MKKTKLYLRMTAVLAAFLLAGGGLLFHTVFAAAAQIYISPGTSGVQNGGNVTVAVRVNTGGGSADSANVTLTYDPSKLTFVSISTGGSPITSAANYTNTGSAIAGGAYTTTPASGDFLLFTATFRAKAGNGSTTLGFSTSGAYGTEVDSGGTNIGAALVGGRVDFSQPVCPSGQTGAWPNCVPITPPSSGGGGDGSSGGSPAPTGGTSGSTSGSSGSSGTPTTSSTPTQQSGTQPTSTPANSGTKPAVGSQQVQFTTAKFTATTQTPTQVYVEYGTSSDNLSFKTPLSSLGTSHDISLDANALTPGQTYYYVIVAQDQQGNTAKSDVQSFTAKGVTLNVEVFDANHKPLSNKQVTLHSDPYQATTNSKGVATFSNVAPGAHHLSYTEGGKTYSQALTVDNDIKTASDGSQTAAPQNLSVVYAGYVSHSGSPVVLVGVLVVVLAAAGAAVYFFRDKLPFGGLKHAGLSAQPVLANGEPARPGLSEEELSELAANDALARIKVPEKPKPGATILPTDGEAVVVAQGSIPVAAAEETPALIPKEETAKPADETVKPPEAPSDESSPATAVQPESRNEAVSEPVAPAPPETPEEVKPAAADSDSAAEPAETPSGKES